MGGRTIGLRAHRTWVCAALFALCCAAVQPVNAQDPSRLSVVDVSADESDATIDFIVTLSAESRVTVTVDRN